MATMNPANVLSVIAGADVVADGSDNMELRFLLNDACVKTGTPWVYGGAVGSRGMTMTIRPGRGPCLRCVLEDMPAPGSLETSREVGVLNTAPGLVAAVESNEIIKLILGAASEDTYLLSFDLWPLDFRRTPVSRRRDCPACGLGRFDYLDGCAHS